MPDSIRRYVGRASHAQDAADLPCFGLRVESHLLQVAIATPTADQRYELRIDEVHCEAADGWLNIANRHLLVEAMETLADRHQMRRRAIAVSLDGDYCVTRVTIGTHEEVNSELAMLANRVPRYLQLGPGEKVTGVARRKIEATVDYAVTGVVNRALIQLIYDAMRSVDIEVSWVEPSLVGIARLVGQPNLWGDRPIMIADGTGKQWDVGIACAGRLLLDYRPANANSEEGLREALDGHISRLRRFCHRHLRGVSGELEELLICGDGDKPARALQTIGDSLELRPCVLGVPELSAIYTMIDEELHPNCVPAVAAVFPLLIKVGIEEIPDMLVQVRRAPDQSWPRQMIRQCWPVIAASLVLIISYGLVSKERHRHTGSDRGRQMLESEIVASNVKFASLARRREWLNHFRNIEKQTSEPDWNQMLSEITQSLPDSAKLNEFRVESNGQVAIDGMVIDETLVYEIVNTLRRLPEVTQVALKGTAPDQVSQSSRFSVRLSTKRIVESKSIGARDE